jgi:hypothetical protein
MAKRKAPAPRAAGAFADPTVANAVAIAEAKAAEVDPVFALIEEHKAACAAHHAAQAIYFPMSGLDPGFHEAEADNDDARECEGNALVDLLACTPTTLEGVAAMLEHLGQPEGLVCDGEAEHTVLSGMDHDGLEEAKSLPLRLAAAVRILIGEARS